MHMYTVDEEIGWKTMRLGKSPYEDPRKTFAEVNIVPLEFDFCQCL
jgi:hypothetical protein